MNKDIHLWTRSCIPCQRVKIQRHTNSELGHFKVPEARFHHLHLDIIGPLPPSQGFSYCLTADRFSRWSEAYPISYMTAETVAATVIHEWTPRFGAPRLITTDQARQLESHLTALIAHVTPRWTQVLPFVLGLCFVINEDINATAAELVYGTAIRLPSDFRDTGTNNVSGFVQQLKQTMHNLKSVPISSHGRKTVLYTQNSPNPDGRGYELVSSVRALVPQKFSVEEELMHVKHVDVKSTHVGVMWKFGRGVISSESNFSGAADSDQALVANPTGRTLEPEISSFLDSRVEMNQLRYIGKRKISNGILEKAKKQDLVCWRNALKGNRGKNRQAARNQQLRWESEFNELRLEIESIRSNVKRTRLCRRSATGRFNGRGGKALHGLCDSSWSLPILCYAFRDEERREYLSKVMDQVLVKHRAYCRSYIDDVAVFSKTWEQHIKHLCVVFQTIQRVGFTINLKKCNFARRRVKFLGHVVGSGQHSPDPGKVESIKNISVPTTKKEIRSFQALTSYYREYIPNIASLVLPLTELTRTEFRI
ncbi:retrovirus-related Pol polyprotein from transposon 17.6 [Trichonephila clavipes]|nr:retrovirus-related Pol polyprotein from transposon 17.6 [Trichonephila clavipes]